MTRVCLFGAFRFFYKMESGVISYRRGVSRCSFNYSGQCEGLQVWNGQQGSLTLFLYVLLRVIKNTKKYDMKTTIDKFIQTSVSFIKDRPTPIFKSPLSQTLKQFPAAVFCQYSR